MNLYWTPQAIRPVFAFPKRQVSKPPHFGLSSAAPFKKSDYYQVVKTYLPDERELEFILTQLDALKSASILGQGLHGITYKILLPGPRQRPVVVKIARNNRLLTKPGSLSTEASLLPRGDFSEKTRLQPLFHPSKTGGQKLLAYIQRNGQRILVTSFVKGENPNLQNNPLTPKMLLAMMKEMLYWQRHGILHYDNNFGNWLVDGDQAFLIDFEWAELLHDRRKKTMGYPTIGYETVGYNDGYDGYKDLGRWSALQTQVSNLDTFESHALFGSYFFDNIRQGLKNHKTLITDQEMRRVFKMYLQAAAYFQEHRPIVYSRDALFKAQARFFKNPTPEVLMLEALRIQAPFDDERDFHATVIHQGSAEEHIRWRWSAYRHAARYMAKATSLLKLYPSLQYPPQPIKKEDAEWIKYLYYHEALAVDQYNKAGFKLVEAIKPYQKKNTPTIQISYKLQSVDELLARLDIPMEPPKPFDNPDDYDIAARIIGAVNQDFKKAPALSPFHKG